MQKHSTSIAPPAATSTVTEYEAHAPVISGDPLPDDSEVDDFLDEVVERALYMPHDDRAYWV